MAESPCDNLLFSYFFPFFFPLISCVCVFLIQRGRVQRDALYHGPQLALELGKESDSVWDIYLFFFFYFLFLLADDRPSFPCCPDRLSELRLVFADLRLPLNLSTTPGVGVSLANISGSATDTRVSSLQKNQKKRDQLSGQQGELALWKSVYINDPVSDRNALLHFIQRLLPFSWQA